jgi:hypothetical protein
MVTCERERLVKALVLELEVTPNGTVMHENRIVVHNVDGVRAADGGWVEGSEGHEFICREQIVGLEESEPPLILVTPHASVAAKFLAGWLE